MPSINRRIVVVEYFFTASQLLAFVIRPDLEQPEVVTIAADTTQLKSDINEASADPREKLADVLRRPSLTRCIAPILDWTDPEDVVCIVPSGELFYTPLHAVDVGGAPLILRNPVFYAPSASVLRYCVHRRHPVNAASRGAAVFGNPNWDLTHAEREAVAVARILNVEPVIGLDVTRRRWDEAFASRDIIHFAGHAEFRKDDPLASFLYLANRETVSAREFFSTAASPIRLITLSGCQTGMSTIHPGDEVLGLTRALLYAGASSLILTLWKVDDASSAELMTRFYEHWLRAGKLKVDALRDAQAEVIATGKTNPYFWGPFMLIGDWV